MEPVQYGKIGCVKSFRIFLTFLCAFLIAYILLCEIWLGEFCDVCDSAWVAWYCVLSLDVNLARWGHSVSIASEDTDDSTFS